MAENQRSLDELAADWQATRTLYALTQRAHPSSPGQWARHRAEMMEAERAFCDAARARIVGDLYLDDNPVAALAKIGQG